MTASDLLALRLGQVNALTKAIFPVCSACLIIFLTMSIYAILGVSYFGVTQPAYFGDWGRAMLTLLAAGTLENWVDYAIDVMGGDPAEINAGVLVYFGTYIVVVGYVLTSILVAVLIENFSAAQEEEIMNTTGQNTLYQRGHMEGVLALRVSNNQLDPLLLQLSTFENSRDLSNRIGGVTEGEGVRNRNKTDRL